jgi:hypothetical protein
MSLEGIISKRADAPYSSGDRGLWVKVKCENREEFVVVAGPIPRALGHGSGLFCWRITIPAGSLTQVASGQELTTLTSAGCGIACNRSPLRRGPWIRLHLGAIDLAHRSC